MEDNIFPFNDRKALQVQDDSICEELYKDFWTKVLDCDDKLGLSKQTLSEIKDSCSSLYWLASYASVVLIRPLDSRYSSISLVGLDGWKSIVHSSVDDRESTAKPDISSPAFYELGPSPTDGIEGLLETMQNALMESASNNAGNMRGQHAGHQGNQKTPSFARTVLCQAMNGTEDLLPIQGGTTDVGLHTGCVRRNTSFPLVLSAVHTILRLEGLEREETDQVFNKCVSAYLLGYLREVALRVTAFSARSVDRVVTIIREIEVHLKMVEDVEFVDAAVGVIEEHHARLIALRPGGGIESPTLLHVHDSVATICDELRPPKFPKIPDLSTTSNVQSQMNQARSDAKKNLAWSDLSSSEYTGELQDAWVQLPRLNKFFWEIATQLENKDVVHDICDLLQKLAHFSKQTALASERALQTPHMMAVVLPSSDLLATWICFCWAHRTAEEQHHPIFAKYGAALDPAGLRHIALDDVRAIRAVECVRRFLGPRFEKPVRPFKTTIDTLKLALEYGSSSKRLCDLHSEELRAANECIEKRWKQIVKTQTELSELDRKLTNAERNLINATLLRQESELRDFKYDQHGVKVMHQVYYDIKKNEDRFQTTYNSLAARIKVLEQTPPELELGLPRSQNLSLQWLFFLYMPTEFHHLSTLAQLAQSKLWKEAPLAEKPYQNLFSWFGSRCSVRPIPVKEANLRLRSHSFAPRDSTRIRNYVRETGVFFPDSFSIDPMWDDRDPFASGRIDTETTIMFTELLPQRVHQSKFMQQFVPMVPSKTRENEGIARREQKPDWLTQEQYVTFTTLRAGPYAQIRCLVEAMQNNLLPFDNACVHILIKQLLFHIGEEGWKVDLGLGEDWLGFALISTQMHHQVDLLRESPKDSDRLLLFGVMSSFYGQFDTECRTCAHGLAGIARRWADDVSDEVRHAERASPALYWKQAKFYGYALLCHILGDLTDTDTDYLEMVELIVLFRSKALFASDDEQSRSLDQPILQVMASRLDGILEVVNRNLNHLSACLSLVLDDVPRNLEWSPVLFGSVQETACFEAESDHLYSINLLNGTVLVDGVLPGLLPSSVVNDPLYRRTFGDRNFEMVVLGFRRYQTARRVEDRFRYEFVVDSSETLHILEEDALEGSGHKLLLLRKETMELPSLLREKHSHWFSEHHGTIVLRQPSYRERRVEYAITTMATYLLPAESCDVSMQKVVDMLPDCDQLVLGETALLRTLNKFEYEEFIHLTVNPERTTLRYSFPRYQLSFELKDTLVASCQFKGFHMQDMRVLDDTLPGLESYIVLAHPDGREKALIREGKIGAQAAIKIPNEWCAAIRYHIYDIHRRFRHLVAVDTIGRLHLAGLYASSACAATDRRMGKPGTVLATELVRQSWTNEPLTDSEESKLIEVSSHANLSSTLSLVCSWLWRSSNSVYFLHGHIDMPRHLKLDLDLLALDEYRRSEFAPRLLSCEELTLLGVRQPKRHGVTLLQHEDSETVAFVRETERKIRDMYVVEGQAEPKRPFPLKRPTPCIGLEKQVYEDIEESYRIFCKLPLKEIQPVNARVIEEIKENVQRQREALESSILQIVSEKGRSTEQRLSQLSGRTETAASLDILRMVYDESITRLYNPCLDVDSQIQLWLGCVDWAVLCVLEDKLQRILLLSVHSDEDAHDLIIELECVREWKPSHHLRWLAFEVEQELQIRPNQFAIVQQLQTNPGSVIQLNMGLGKTRVLVPMLILDLMSSKSTGSVCMLPSIIGEAMAYFRIVLVSSVQHVKLFSLKFERGIPLDAMRARQLSDEIARCREHLGFLVVTPQHLNSLLLKQYDQDVFVEGLQEPFVDILDESDAILSHDFQLVYALGNQVPLPSGPSRWTVLQGLLTIFARTQSEDVLKITNDPLLVHQESSRNGSFPKMRLLLPFKGHEYEVGAALCRQLLANPPHELRWMKDVPSEEVELLVSIMSDPTFMDVLETIQSNNLFKKRQSDILSARGFIAYGSLFHGLESRYRVNYGLLTGSNPKTKMAVPYSASDTPKQSAQYSHPDMELIYTALSYFYEGLTESQLKAALECLQNMGPVAQEDIYGEWISSAQEDIVPEELSKFDHILKVDVNNKLQLGLIHKNLRSCMEVVSFWTDNFVYRTDTYQFPSKRATSAWNLCDSGKAIGFSGTDDNRFLLPQSVAQIPPEEEEVRATNGAMISRILDCTKSIHVLQNGSGDNSPMWKAVLDQCVSLGVQALIDVAGLMAGSKNDQSALYLAKRLDKESFRGVLYFDMNSESWVVCETENHRCVSLQSSSHTDAESECFVYFDESRCRGANRKLQSNAVALVTLEPKITKDKFLQGCARLRKLRKKGQSIVLAGTSEVLSRYSTTEHVLEKILHHTAVTTKKGILTYYQRGLNYASFPKPIEDDFSLETMYAGNILDYGDLCEFLDATHENEELTGEVEELVKYCKEIGQGTATAAMGQLSEECEQEVENEVEHEEQEEIEISQQDPFPQEDWSFAEAFSNPEKLFQNLFLQLKEFTKERLSCMSVIEWSMDLYCTPNFWKTIQVAESSKDLSLYLRPVNAMLVMPDGRVVLISAYELDMLLPAWWVASDQNPKAILQHVCTANTGQGFGRDSIAISDAVLTLVKLFRGDVQYSEQQKRVLVETFRRVPESHLVVQQFLHMRSRLGFFSRSDLEEISSRLYL